MRKTIFALFLLSACSEKTVLFKPSVELDPLPVDKGAAPAAAAADPLRGKQWNLDKVGAPAKAGNPNIVVAVISTGIDYTHEDLQGRVLVNQREVKPIAPESPIWINQQDDDDNGLVDDIVGYDVVSNDGFAFDRHGMGTAMAGVIAARRDNGIGIAGLLDEVRLYPIRYIGDDGQTSVYHLIRALEVAAAVKPSVIALQIGQLYLGGRFGDSAISDVELGAVRDQLAALHAARIPIVVGAGNNNAVFGSKPFEALLQSFDNVAIVTASDKDDALHFLANYSNQYVITAAPGSEVLTTKLGNSYGPVSSTALAAAHVAAAFAAVIAERGPVAPEKLISALARPDASDAAPGLRLATLGQNRLNVTKFATLPH